MSTIITKSLGRGSKSISGVLYVKRNNFSVIFHNSYSHLWLFPLMFPFSIHIDLYWCYRSSRLSLTKQSLWISIVFCVFPFYRRPQFFLSFLVSPFYSSYALWWSKPFLAISVYGCKAATSSPHSLNPISSSSMGCFEWMRYISLFCY